MIRLLPSTASIMNRILSYLRTIGCVDDSNEQIIAYGLKRLINTTVDFIFCLVFAGILGDILVGVIFEIAYYLLRIYAGGYHAPTPRACLYLSYFSAIAALLYIFLVPVPAAFSISLTIVSALIVIVMSPMESPNKPLYPEERIYYRKKCIVITIIELLVFSILLYVRCFLYTKALSVSLFMVAIGQVGDLLARKKASLRNDR